MRYLLLLVKKKLNILATIIEILDKLFDFLMF